MGFIWSYNPPFYKYVQKKGFLGIQSIIKSIFKKCTINTFDRAIQAFLQRCVKSNFEVYLPLFSGWLKAVAPATRNPLQKPGVGFHLTQTSNIGSSALASVSLENYCLKTCCRWNQAVLLHQTLDWKVGEPNKQTAEEEPYDRVRLMSSRAADAAFR